MTNSVAMFTYISRYIGHGRAAHVSVQMKSTGAALKDEIVREGTLSEDGFEEPTAPERIRTMGYRP